MFREGLCITKPLNREKQFIQYLKNHAVHQIKKHATAYFFKMYLTCQIVSNKTGYSFPIFPVLSKLFQTSIKKILFVKKRFGSVLQLLVPNQSWGKKAKKFCPFIKAFIQPIFLISCRRVNCKVHVKVTHTNNFIRMKMCLNKKNYTHTYSAIIRLKKFRSTFMNCITVLVVEMCYRNMYVNQLTYWPF